MKFTLTLRVINRAMVNHYPFVPPCSQVSKKDLQQLQELLDLSKYLIVLTGAGVSTESGIPDYRSVGVGLYARTTRRPVQYQDYVRSSAARQRYWARNYIGWPHFAAMQPNSAHFAFRRWEKAGRLDYVISQNVDELHQKAGSERVINLHGSTHRVVCLSCDHTMPRWDLQSLFTKANQGWTPSELNGQLAPDGDVLLSDDAVKNFQVPACPSCGGILKPDVIFFGDNVANALVERIYSMIEQCDCLLVVGSSLHVYSGYRFALRAHSLGKKLIIINIGSTRADWKADFKLEARAGDVIPQIIR